MMEGKNIWLLLFTLVLLIQVLPFSSSLRSAPVPVVERARIRAFTVQAEQGACPTRQESERVRREITEEVRRNYLPQEEPTEPSTESSTELSTEHQGSSTEPQGSSTELLPEPSTEQGPQESDSTEQLTEPQAPSTEEQESLTEPQEAMCGGAGWSRVAFVNMSNPNQNCPMGLKYIASPIRMCGLYTSSSGCSSTTFSIGGLQYNQVCGRVIGYQYGYAYAFVTSHQIANIDARYMDGVSLTHGAAGNRRHVWSFAASFSQANRVSTQFSCPSQRGTNTPSFVGVDYFCESGNRNDSLPSAKYYTDNPLWDGVGCTAEPDTYCNVNNPPWFHKTLPSSTMDDLELRVCAGFSHRDNYPVHLVELYVR